MNVGPGDKHRHLGVSAARHQAPDIHGRLRRRGRCELAAWRGREANRPGLDCGRPVRHFSECPVAPQKPK